MTFAAIFTLALLVLKLADLAPIPWWVVLVPVGVAAGLIVLAYAFCGLVLIHAIANGPKAKP